MLLVYPSNWFKMKENEVDNKNEQIDGCCPML